MSLIGTLVAFRYEVTQELVGDGIFDVFKGIDRQRNRPVKLRILRPNLAKDQEFVGELKDLAAQHAEIHHPAMERIYEMVPHEETWVLISEHEDGAVLEDRLRRLTTFSVPAGLAIIISTCEALVGCHEAGLVHGDISARTLYSKQTDGVKLMCAGFWRAYAQNAYSARQALPSMAPYLAPEISEGEMPSAQSDIYAVGVLLFRILTGRFPYLGDTPAGLAHQHATALPPSLRKSLPAGPQALDEVVLRCLAKHPDDRYESVTDLLRDLRMIQDGLRFGRKAPVAPISDREEGSAVRPRKGPAPVKVVAVKTEAPAQEAAVEPEDPETRKKSRRSEDGVPRWLAFLAFLGVLMVAFTIAYWAYVNISAPPTQKVPDLVGQTVQDAVTVLNGQGLTMTVVERASEKPKGVILSLDPAPGEDVRSAFPIKAVVSAGSADVVVPDVRGRSLDEAKTLLATLDLKVSEDYQYVRDPDLPVNQVVDQAPSPRQKTRRLSTIRLTVNSLSSEDVLNKRQGEWHTFTLEIPLPVQDSNSDMLVRVDMLDEDGVTTIHEGYHRPEEVMGVKVNGKGSPVTFTVYVNNELYDQIEKTVKAPEGEAAER